MASQTAFAGLEVLAPADLFSLDGFRFQSINPTLTDRLLQIGAVTHKHDEHAALANPAVQPTVTQSTEGGTIPAHTTLKLVHTWVDNYGGETLPSPVSTLTTPEGLLPPAKAPTVAADYTAGALLAGNYTYAVTVTDGAGGETSIGPSVSVVVNPGHAKARVDVTGLKAILEEVTALAEAKWRLWRQQEGGPWYLMATGNTAEIHDDGSLAGDCTVEPPRTGTTRSTNSLKVVVPAAPEGAKYFRLYLTETEQFLSPALVAQYPLSEIGKTIVLTSLAVILGQPPLVTTSYPGANKINSETDILNFHWKTPVKTVGELPALGNEAGDVRFVTGTFEFYGWNNTAKAWENLSQKFMVTTHTFALRGPVTLEPPIPPHEIEINEEERQITSLIAVRYRIIAGTSLSFRLQKNGANIAGYGTAEAPLVAEKAKKRTAAAAVGLVSGDEIYPLLTALSGEPSGAHITLALAQLLQ